MSSVPVKPPRRTLPADAQESDAQPEPRLDLSLGEIFRILRNRRSVVLGVAVVLMIMVVAFHWRFPPWVEGHVTLQMGQDVGRSLQRSGQTLEETFLKEREEIARTLLEKAPEVKSPETSPAQKQLTKEKPTESLAAARLCRSSRGRQAHRAPSLTPLRKEPDPSQLQVASS